MSAFGMKLRRTEHCLLAASNSATRAETQSFFAGSSGQFDHMVIWVCACAAPVMAASSNAAFRPVFTAI